jgi:hypothetical protein
MARFQRRQCQGKAKPKTKPKKKPGTYDDARPVETDEPPEKPVLRRVVCADITVEKLAVALEDNPRGVLLARDELNGWLTAFQRYKGSKGGNDLPNWLELHRAGTLIVDRKTSDRQTLFVLRAAVAITGTIQPGVLARVLTPSSSKAACSPGCCWRRHRPRPRSGPRTRSPPEAEAAYRTLLDRLFTLTPWETVGVEGEPHVLTLSPGAQRLWVSFYIEWAEEQARAEEELAAASSKLEAYAARFALIHHVVSHVNRGRPGRGAAVGEKSIQAVITLCHWFAREARRIYATFSETEAERHTRKLLEYITAHGGTVTARHLTRANPSRYPKSGHGETALDLLDTAGLAEWALKETGTKGGRPVSVLVLRS